MNFAGGLSMFGVNILEHRKKFLMHLWSLRQSFPCWNVRWYQYGFHLENPLRAWVSPTTLQMILKGEFFLPLLVLPSLPPFLIKQILSFHQIWNYKLARYKAAHFTASICKQVPSNLPRQLLIFLPSLTGSSPSPLLPWAHPAGLVQARGQCCSCRVCNANGIFTEPLWELAPETRGCLGGLWQQELEGKTFLPMCWLNTNGICLHA